MQQTKKYLRFAVALTCLTSAFLLSVSVGDRGLLVDLRQSSGAANDPSSVKEGERYELSALRVFNRVLINLSDSYVEPERIKPDRMLVSSLEEIQNSIAPVVISYVKKGDEVPEEVTVQVNDKKRVFKVAGVQSLWEMSFKLKEIFGFIQDTLGDDPDVDYQQVEYAAINGMLETLDPHSTLLPPVNYEEMQTQTGGKFGGLGIVISIRDNSLTVMSPIDGTPASRAGIKARDKIVRIAEESTVNMSLTEAVGMLRGEPGTKVNLWLMRQGWDEPRKFAVERAIIKIESVESQPLANKIGYIRIKNFQQNTTPDTRAQLKELKEKMGGMQGLVLDLRDNPGGLLNQSISISDLFIDEGTIVSTVGQGNKMRDKKSARSSGTEPKYPMIVLVNPGSASASEIVSGAIQNNDRGVILGDTTFGKGSVQVLYEFPDSSALKLTIAQYLTPGDVSIQGKGITPDLRAVPVRVDDKGVDLFESNNIFREGDLAAALTSDAVSKDKKIVPALRYLKEVPAEGKDDGFSDGGFQEDYEIKLAQRLLVAAGTTWQRGPMLKAIAKELGEVSEKEQAEITKSLKARGIDWSSGPSPASPMVALDVVPSVDKGEVKAGEKMTLTAKLTNTGSSPIHRVKAITKSDNGVLNDREFIFGKLAPGETREFSVDVKIPQDTPDRLDFVRFEISDAANPISAEQGVDVRVLGQPRPHFAFSYEVNDASGDGVLSVGEEVGLKVHVHNVGKADSAETLIYLKNKSRDAIYLEKGRSKVEKVAASGSEVVDFTFKAQKEPESGEYTFEVDVYDVTYREFTQKKFSIPFAKTSTKATEATGTVTIKKPVSARAGASAKAEPVAELPKGAVASVFGKAGGFFKVELQGRTGWVDSAVVTFAEGASGDPKGIDALSLFRSPDVELTTSAMLTDKPTVSLQGVFADDSAIKDYYVFVYNRADSTFNTRKVVYERVGKKKVDAKVQIPLFDGMNRIAVFVRDETGMTTTKSVYVFKK